MADSPEKKRITEWTPVVPIPPDCPIPPPREYPHRGEPLRRYLYHDRHGAALGWVYEYLDSEKKTLYLTCCYARNAEGERAWRWLAFPEPRPLYGLMDIAGSPAVEVDGGEAVAIPVLVFPTETDADAAREALTGVQLDPAGKAVADLPCVSWPGGLLSATKADWAALAGWRVVIWPEYSRKRKALNTTEKAAGVDPDSKPFLKALDQPGWRTAGKIAEKLTGAGCGVHVMALPEVGAEPAGWGVRRVIEQGITGSALWEYIRVRLQPFSPKASGTDKPTSQATAQVMAEAEPPSTPPPAGAGPRGEGEDWSWLKLLKCKDDKPLDLDTNVYRYLMHHPALRGMVWADVFGKRMMMRKPAPWVHPEGFVERPWEDNDNFQLKVWLADQDNYLIKSTGTIDEAARAAARSNEYHPVKEYLESLKWDGTPRNETWLSVYAGVKDTPYSKLTGPMFLRAMVARVMNPGCLMRTMLIFEGAQYRGKSSIFRTLGGDWFSDTSLNLDGKDWMQNIWGRWLYEWAEMDSLGKTDFRKVKNVISSPKDTFRPPYDRMPGEHLRQTVFVGTTNEYHDYFWDPSGSTRFWPVRTEENGAIKIDALERDRNQLFAEALVEYRAGKHWWPTQGEQREIFEPEQSLRERSDAWEWLIEQWLDANPVTKITASELLTNALKIDPGKIPPSGAMETRVGLVMAKLHWRKIRESNGRGRRVYYYIPPENWFTRKTAGEPRESVDDGPL